MKIAKTIKRCTTCALFILVVFSFSACSLNKESTQSDLEVERAIARNTQRINNAASKTPVAALPAQRLKDEIAPGFLIKISTEDDKSLKGKYRVDFDGRLELPYDVTINAGGISFPELKKRITDAYRPYFVGTPDLTISIAERDRYVEVGGLVVKPGRFLMKDNSTIDELIASAGGLVLMQGNTGEYAAKYININQEGSSRLVRLSEYYAGAQGLIPAWRGGDKVFFQSEGADATSASAAGKNYVQILGQVGSPGEYIYENDSDFFFYLSKAGGPKDNADLNNLEIIRVTANGRESIFFKMKDVNKIPPIYGGDIIVVHVEKPKNLISNFTSVVGALATSVIAGAAL